MTRAGSQIVSADIDAYDLAFVRPWQTSRISLDRRRGWLLTLEDESGCSGIGECAPLPGTGTETQAQARKALAVAGENLEGRTPGQLLGDMPDFGNCVAARCAVETALLDLESRRLGQPLRRLLEPDACDVLNVNATLGGADDALPLRAAEALASGFTTLKIKVGVHEWRQELAALRSAAEAAGCDALLRLDANGAWSQDIAQQRLTDLCELPIDCVEEPLAEMDPVFLSELQASLPYALAADESLPGVMTLVEEGKCPVRRIVLKPTVLGGALPALRIARLAAAHGLEVVVTTTLEAAPGRALATQLAAATRSPLAHGLDTAAWLDGDIAQGPDVTGGKLILDDRLSGLGVQLFGKGNQIR